MESFVSILCVRACVSVGFKVYLCDHSLSFLFLSSCLCYLRVTSYVALLLYTRDSPKC